MDVGTWNVCGVRELCGTLGRAERRLLRLAEESFVSSGARAASTGGLPKQAKFVLPSLSRFANCPPANPLDQQGVPILAVDGDADDGVYMCRWPPSDSGARNRDFNRE